MQFVKPHKVGKGQRSTREVVEILRESFSVAHISKENGTPYAELTLMLDDTERFRVYCDVRLTADECRIMAARLTWAAETIEKGPQTP